MANDGAGAPQVFAEDWASAWGSPYMIDEGGDEADSGQLREDGDAFLVHDGVGAPLPLPLAFVDGVRRGEGSLYARNPSTGQIARGIAGAHACGCVIAREGSRPEFGEMRITRLVVWGSGVNLGLPRVRGGWDWQAVSIANTEPDGPFKDIQQRMRREEGRLADSLAEAGHLVITDGPLQFVRSLDQPVVGYVKTHWRTYLAPEIHARVPELGPGQRSSLFELRERYSCYLRLANPTPWSGPWAGIVRLEIPQSAGIAEAKRVADLVAGALPRFAGVPHVDPRAPQNLQPIGALETRLKHQLGDLGLAERALREAVRLLSTGVTV